MAKIDIHALSRRGATNWKDVPDSEFPQDLRDDPSQMALVREQLLRPVDEAVRQTPEIPNDKRLAGVLRAFWGTRILMKVTRQRNLSDMPIEMQAVEAWVQGRRIEVPNDRWCGVPPAYIEAFMEAHTECTVEVLNAEPPKLPRGSDYAFEGLRMTVRTPKDYSVQVYLPRVKPTAEQNAA